MSRYIVHRLQYRRSARARKRYLSVFELSRCFVPDPKRRMVKYSKHADSNPIDIAYKFLFCCLFICAFNILVSSERCPLIRARCVLAVIRAAAAILSVHPPHPPGDAFDPPNHLAHKQQRYIDGEDHSSTTSRPWTIPSTPNHNRTTLMRGRWRWRRPSKREPLHHAHAPLGLSGIVIFVFADADTAWLYGQLRIDTWDEYNECT